VDPIVRFQNISKTYDGRTQVVRDLNLSVERGEFLTLLGPSGSGKTTSLMMLAGFEAPTSGEIYLENRPFSSLPPHRREIGMVFQNYALFPHMSVGENIAFPLQVRRIGKQDIEVRVRRALDMVQLPGVVDRKPTELSGGQQQRVALARALVYEPAIVLMDEPLGALDRQLREGMQLEIKKLHQRIGVTMIYVTHDQQEALTMSDRIAVFNRGGIEQLSVPKALYDAPANAFVANFIGDNNLLRGRVVRRIGDQAEVEMPGVGMVRARASNAEMGQQVLLAIRPEKIALAVGDRRPSEVNRLSGNLIDRTYLGDQTRLSIQLPDQQMLTIKTGSVPFDDAEGPVNISWAAEDSVVFAA
jgi:putative spermidine/putrescine transport system ATP-binding protein